MSEQVDQPTERWGLLANGSSRLWHIDVDESLAGDEWIIEIDGPQTYLAFQLENLKVLEAALRLLQSGPPSDLTAEDRAET